MAVKGGRLQRKSSKWQHPSMSINLASAGETRGAPRQRRRRAVRKAPKMRGTTRRPGNNDAPGVSSYGQSIAAIGVQ